MLPGALAAHAHSLLPGARIVTYGIGDPLTQPSGSSHPAVVADGLIKLRVHSDQGRVATLHHLRPGAVLWLRSVYHAMTQAELPRACSYVAAQASRVVHLDRPAVAALAREQAEVAWELARLASNETLELCGAARRMAFASTAERVARELLALAAPDPAAGGNLVARVTQQDLADEVGSVREVVSRIVNEFSKLGMISLARGSITIVDRAGVQRAAEP